MKLPKEPKRNDVLDFVRARAKRRHVPVRRIPPWTVGLRTGYIGS